MDVWKIGFSQVIELYAITKSFPAEERYGLISDIKRAANSVTNNIAEGFGRYERKDKTRFYKISRGSCYELINQMLTSCQLGFIKEQESNKIITNYKNIIAGLDALIKSIETN